MFRYSLKELLYWLTVWCVALCVLSAVTPKSIGVIAFAIWFVGTTVSNRSFGYRAGFYYACVAGIVVCLLTFMLTPPMNQPGTRFNWVALPFLVLFALPYGAIVWLIAVGFDRLYRLLSSSE
jgi:hypothetical protein